MMRLVPRHILWGASAHFGGLAGVVDIGCADAGGASTAPGIGGRCAYGDSLAQCCLL